MIGIYKITNLITGKAYYGSSSHIEDRQEYHFRVGREWTSKPINNKSVLSTFYQDIHDLGKENFRFEVLEEFDKVSLLEEREQFYIDNSTEELYNMDRKVGKVARGIDASKAKLSSEQLTEIISLLKENKLSDREIAKKYNICFNAISEINNGYTYHQDNETYPIRKFQQKGHGRLFTDEEVITYRKEYDANGHQAKILYNRDNLQERMSYCTFYRMCKRETYKEI